MTVSKNSTESSWVDPDDAPELTREWFEQADQHANGVLVKRGRRPSDNPKKAVSLRLDNDVVERFKADGPGWQSRMNEALRKAAGL
jgi:uncharacterized protein (DUF4415 family)